VAGETKGESAKDFERVEQLDAPRVVRAIAAAGGPTLQLRELLSGGAVGAWVVRWDDGHESVMTWSPPLREGQRPGSLDRAIEMMDLAADAGVPVPRYEAVVPLADGGVAVVQERIVGVTPELVTPGLIDRLLKLVECRRGLTAGTAFAGQPLPLYLRSDGPGFCLHDPVRTFSATTAVLLDAIEDAVDDDDDDQLDGVDVVHLDFHIGNVLVDPGDPARVVAIVDWGGAAPGQVELDLAILAFDLTWRSPGPIQERVERHLLETTEQRLFAKVWAHASLRLLDWTVRHFPHDIDHWTTVAARHLPA
jgi:Phosphotransferase enzyme family